MPVQTPQFNYLNYGKAIEQGNRNALLQMQMQNMPEQMRMQQERQRMDMMVKGLQYVKTRAPFVNDQDSYTAFRDSTIKGGLFSPEEIPEKYDPSYINRIAGIAGKQLETFGDVGPIPGAPEGTYGQRSKTTGKYHVTNKPGKNGKGGSGSPSGLKASDENAIYKQSASLFGGLYDPQTDRFSALSKDDAQRTQAIAERATRLFVDADGGLTRTQAVAKAARELGIKIEDLKNKKQDTSPKAPVLDMNETVSSADIRPGERTAKNKDGQRAVYRNNKWLLIKD